MIDLEKLLKVVDPDPVLINQQACLRARHIRAACRACSDICPVEAVGYADRKLTVDSTRCTRCGLCLGVCPTAALQVRGIDEAALDGAAQVHCSRAPGEGVELPCLGVLSHDHVVDLGSRQAGVVLTAGECETCTLARGGALAKATLAAAAETLKALGVGEPPQWRTSHGGTVPAAQQSVGRRELLALWGRSAVQTGRSLLPDREVNPVKLPAKVPVRRLRWLKRFAPPQHDGTLAWPTRRVTPGCNGCTICVAFCPAGALSARDEGNTWTLSFQTASCVGCKTCIDLCPRRVLEPGETPLVKEVLGGTVHDLVTVAAADRPVAGGFRPTR